MLQLNTGITFNKTVKLIPITTLRFVVASPLYRKTLLRNGVNLAKRYK